MGQENKTREKTIRKTKLENKTYSKDYLNKRLENKVQKLFDQNAQIKCSHVQKYSETVCSLKENQFQNSFEFTEKVEMKKNKKII